MFSRHNEDGSYTYGYESGDGSFKIETKSPTGEVKGKYGYKDDTGKVSIHYFNIPNLLPGVFFKFVPIDLLLLYIPSSWITISLPINYFYSYAPIHFHHESRP